MLGKRIYEIMSTKVIHIQENDSLEMAFRLFEENRISGIPVMNAQGQYVGVLSKTDLVSTKMMHMMQEKRSPSEIYVREFMNPNPPISLDQYDSVDEAIEQMYHNGVHRVFVKNDDGNLVGVVSTFDIVKLMRGVAQANLLKSY